MRIFIVISTICFIFLASFTFAAEKDSNIQWWGKAPGQHPTVVGKVVNVGTTNIAVQTKNGLKTFNVDTMKTKVRIRGVEAKITDVKIGDQAIVRFKLVQNNISLALRVIVPKPNAKKKIVSIHGNEIILKNDNAEQRVIVNENTKYRCGAYKGNISDLKVGYFATAFGDLSNNTLNADVIEFRAKQAKGAIVAIDGNIITIKTVKQMNIVGNVSDATSIVIKPRIGPNKKGTLADLRVGMPVNIHFHPDAGGPVPLLVIAALTGI